MTKDPKPEPQKVTCPECEYQGRCFGLLLFAEYFGGLCQQGRRKAIREHHAAPTSPPGDDT
jgi:hypothetical protein